MKGIHLLSVCHEFVRSPTGQRVIEELKRHLAEPRNRRHLVDLAKGLRAGRQEPIVVDADPPDR